MKTLSTAIRNYLQLRRSLGFKLVVDERHLRNFADFLKQRKTSHITTPLALEFATKGQRLDRGLGVQRMCAVRAFACYYSGFDPKSEIPPVGLLRCSRRRARPRFCSQRDIIKLLAAARNAEPTSTRGLRPWTLYTLFGLLTVTGMRISEAINLKSEDVDWKEATITIRNTKFGKSRLLPLHHSTLKALGAYARRRDRFLGGSWRGASLQHSPAHFFVSNCGTALSASNLRIAFKELLRKSGLETPDKPRTRIHDLRHRFAVDTIRRWYRNLGEDVERRIPVLATYLGHVNVTATYWYLSCTPQLRAAASDRVEARWKGVGHVTGQ